MALNIDTAKPLRRPTELRDLVDAINGAHRSDEPDWLEWKSTLDLLKPAGRFHVARAILGLANRQPARAATYCGGVGYIVVGADPDEIHGVEDVDPAMLEDGIGPYLGGAKGPGWNPTYIKVDRKHVLVVMVEAPRPGDPMFPLRKEYPGAARGTVFVRKQGKTDRANDADIDALQDRARATSVAEPQLAVTIAGSTPLRWFDRASVASDIASWIEGQRNAMLTHAESVERERSNPNKVATSSTSCSCTSTTRPIAISPTLNSRRVSATNT
jgi:hypothetical protein